MLPFDYCYTLFSGLTTAAMLMTTHHTGSWKDYFLFALNVSPLPMPRLILPPLSPGMGAICLGKASTAASGFPASI